MKRAGPHSDLILAAIEAAVAAIPTDTIHIPRELLEVAVVAGARKLLELIEYDRVDVTLSPAAVAGGVIHFGD